MSELSDFRILICNSCPYNEEGLCILCGCDVVEKTAKPDEFCPLLPAKWEAEVVKMEKGAESTGRITAQPTPPPRTVCIPCNRR